MDLQKEFIRFHDTIKLDDENATLREKREILLDKLKNNISDEAASYTTFVQGSYAMGTGIKPENGDYDIDVGIRFDIDREDYDPLTPKKWVRDALDGHTKSVKIRKSCVTVTYQRNSEPIYHVDFAVYADANVDTKMYIAKGKESSPPDEVLWEVSDPQGLLEKIRKKYSDADERGQFRRIIRYLKKWRDHDTRLSGNGMPSGIALTCLAYDLFSVSKTYDSIGKTFSYNDLAALLNLVQKIKGKFTYRYDSEKQSFYHAISESLVVEPYNNLFEKMSSTQMETLYQEFGRMIETLEAAQKAMKKSEACTLMVELFGKDFPVTTDRSYVGTSESA